MNKSLAVSGASLLVSALIIPVVVFAAELRMGESPSFSSSETIQKDLYLAGGNVTSSGKVNGDLAVGGGNILINGAVSQDLFVGGGSITIVADVGDDVRAGGGNIVINSHVRGNVSFKGQKLTLGKEAIFDGNLDYSAQKEATIEAGAVVKGQTNYEPLKAPRAPISGKGIIAFLSLVFLGKFLSLLVFALALGLFFNRYSAV